jgi:hypothetical protein
MSYLEENAKDVLLYRYGTKINRNANVSKTHTGLETKDVSSARETLFIILPQKHVYVHQGLLEMGKYADNHAR